MKRQRKSLPGGSPGPRARHHADPILDVHGRTVARRISARYPGSVLLDILNEHFGRPGIVWFEQGNGGARQGGDQDFVRLCAMSMSRART